MVKTKQLGKVEPELNERIVNYSKLIGISKTDLIEELFNKEIEDKVLTNDFINISEIYYFNMIDLQKNKEVKTSKVKPTTNLNDVFIVKKVPNNLDVFNKAKRTFCYNGVAEKHLGIYSYNRMIINPVKANETNFFQYYILFEYDSKTEELILKLTNPDELYLLFDVNDIEDVISDLTSINKEYITAKTKIEKLPDEATIEGLFTFSETEGINIGLWLTSILVIQSLEETKSFSWSIAKNNPEAYEELKGKYNSNDLVLIRDFKTVEKDNTKYVAIKSNEGASKNE